MHKYSAMTVNGLWQSALKEVKKHNVSLSTLKGKTIVVNISIWLHQIIQSIDEIDKINKGLGYA